jgi:hypothetical protein
MLACVRQTIEREAEGATCTVDQEHTAKAPDLRKPFAFIFRVGRVGHQCTATIVLACELLRTIAKYMVPR